jgi:hypothetical protein
LWLAWLLYGWPWTPRVGRLRSARNCIQMLPRTSMRHLADDVLDDLI